MTCARSAADRGDACSRACIAQRARGTGAAITPRPSARARAAIVALLGSQRRAFQIAAADHWLAARAGVHRRSAKATSRAQSRFSSRHAPNAAAAWPCPRCPDPVSSRLRCAFLSALRLTSARGPSAARPSQAETQRLHCLHFCGGRFRGRSHLRSSFDDRCRPASRAVS